jgi:signal transduction histidine kinase/DNA-binding response OmpR family regulator
MRYLIQNNMFLNKLKLGHKLLMGFGIVIALMVFILIYTYINYDNQTKAVDDNLSSAEIIQEADEILLSLLNMETGARGYAITGSEDFLDPFYKGENDYIDHYAHLEKLIKDKKYEVEYLKILNEKYLRWFDWETTQVIDNRTKVNEGTLSMEELVDIVNSQIGKSEMDSIRNIVNKLIDEEKETQEIRYQTLIDAEQKTGYVMTFGGFLTALLSIAISLFTALSISRPVKLLIAATNNIKEQKYQNQLKLTGDKDINLLINGFNEMQEMIKSRENELNIKNNELKAQMAEVNEANKLKSQFLANMSHELRTPLNSIIGFTNRVIKKSGETLPVTQLENLTIVRDEANHLLELINGILDYSKIEAGKMEIHAENFNLLKVADEVYQMTKTLAETQNIGYKQVAFTDTEIPIYSDRMKVKQILINLLSNAFKYSESGTVTFSVGKKESNYYIRVKDEGVGISREDLSHIFDEFRQVDGTYTRKVGGTGLGLSITKKFVEMLGGEIKVCSTVGKGSCFTVILPENIEHKAENLIENDDDMMNADDRKTIVCVDDDPNIQRLYRQYLNDYEFKTIALNGQENVVEKIKEIRPDAILLDIMLPTKDGWEILSELKDNVDTRNIPVIMASVLSEKKLAFRMKADEYLIKPVTQDELLDTIMRTISKKRGIDVLVGDDDENFLNLIGQFLEEEGIPYRLAKDGDAVLKEMQFMKPDILILDIMMPKKDGFTVIEEVRSKEEIKDTPIIVVTAKDLTNKEKEELHERTSIVIQKSAVMMDTVMENLVRRIKEKFENA